MRPLASRFWIFFLTFTMATSVFADRFSVDESLQKEPHTILTLSDRQTDEVGRLRRLELSPRQRTILQEKIGRRVPRVFGVESPSEPDCSCHVSSVFWLDARRVVVWTDRLKYDRSGSKDYYKIRLRPGYFVMDRHGHLYAAGQRISFQEFERRLATPRPRKAYFQVSLPPEPPRAAEKALLSIREKHQFNFRL